MIRTLVAVIAIFCAFFAYSARAFDAESDERAARDVTRRVNGQGDANALMELVRLNPRITLPILQGYALRKTTDPQAADVAIRALREIAGACDYYRARIDSARAHAGGEYETPDDFKMLTLIGGADAVAVVAPLLFDETKAQQLEADNGASDYRWQSAAALTKMNLPDAPVSKPYYRLTEDDLKLWIKWATDRGYNKLSANEKKGQPHDGDVIPASSEKTTTASEANNDPVLQKSAKSAGLTNENMQAKGLQFSVWAGIVIIPIVLLFLWRQQAGQRR